MSSLVEDELIQGTLFLPLKNHLGIEKSAPGLSLSIRYCLLVDSAPAFSKPFQQEQSFFAFVQVEWDVLRH